MRSSINDKSRTEEMTELRRLDRLRGALDGLSTAELQEIVSAPSLRDAGMLNAEDIHVRNLLAELVEAWTDELTQGLTVPDGDWEMIDARLAGDIDGLCRAAAQHCGRLGHQRNGAKRDVRTN